MKREGVFKDHPGWTTAWWVGCGTIKDGDHQHMHRGHTGYTHVLCISALGALVRLGRTTRGISLIVRECIVQHSP